MTCVQNNCDLREEHLKTRIFKWVPFLPLIETRGVGLRPPLKPPKLRPLWRSWYIYIYIISRERERARERERKRERERERLRSQNSHQNFGASGDGDPACRRRKSFSTWERSSRHWRFWFGNPWEIQDLDRMILRQVLRGATLLAVTCNHLQTIVV